MDGHRLDANAVAAATDNFEVTPIVTREAMTMRAARHSPNTPPEHWNMSKACGLLHPFDDPEQQLEIANGIWLFLATALIFFGCMFIVYTVYQRTYLSVRAGSIT